MTIATLRKVLEDRRELYGFTPFETAWNLSRACGIDFVSDNAARHYLYCDDGIAHVVWADDDRTEMAVVEVEN